MLPLLRAPPFANAPCISWTVDGWEKIVSSVPANFDPVDDVVAAAVIAGRVGGCFWVPPCLPRGALPGGELSILILPEDVEAALQFCKQMLKAVAASGLVAVVPRLRSFGGLTRQLMASGCTVVQKGDPHLLLDHAGSIFVAQISDEAVLGLLAGRRVIYCGLHGMERLAPNHALTWLRSGTRYRNPFSGETAECAEIIDVLTDWRRMLERNRRVAVCAGMAVWKRRRIAQLFANAGEPPVFRRSVKGILAEARKRQGAVAVWSTRIPPGLESKAARAGVTLLRVEDGFIRSRGLGSDFLPPSSIVADSRGDYFDPSRISDLEHLLATTEFSATLQARAKRLIQMLTSLGVSKYASGGAAPVLAAQPGQRVLLVPGQVADDLSVQLGGGRVRDNHDLLARVRAENPDSFIVYRPHPDVDAGHRPGAIPDKTALALADTICRGAIAPLIGAVDEVHTITSLAGFEALLRGRVVKTYGQAFYAGWGLTVDDEKLARRQRRLSIEELAAGVLILYPYYVDPATGLPCGPELLISRLQEPALWQPSLLTKARRLQGRLRRRLSVAAQP